MTIFNVIQLIGGLAIFLYGMHVMSDGLSKLAGGQLEKSLKKITSSPIKALLLGTGVTAVVQSSSAVTVMLVGLVNSGIMDLRQTIGIIMGSNIGTTVTAWILSLTGIESSNTLLQLAKPANFSPIVAAIGVIMIMASKHQRKRDMGTILVAFAVLMYGMEFMGDAVEPLKDMPEFSSILTYFTNPLLGVVVGAVFTGIIQSSSASVGVLQALSMTGSISYAVAIPIIMGQNIGTCVTALISSIGVSRNARRVAAVHVSFNLIGTAVCLVLFFLARTVFPLAFLSDAIDPAGIAVCHSIFNVFTTILLLPFNRQLEKLAKLLVPDRTHTPQKTTTLDDRLLLTPGVAVSECGAVVADMASLARQSVLSSMDMLSRYDAQLVQDVQESETRIDGYEDLVGTFLVKLSGKNLTTADGRSTTKYLYLIGDLERLGDHAVNIMEAGEELHNKRLSFSSQAKAELKVVIDAVTEILNLSIDAFLENDLNKARRVEPLEEVIDELIGEAKTRHINRLQQGTCTIELGFILSDILNNAERSSDHCSNIAVCLLQIAEKGLETHTYLHSVRVGTGFQNMEHDYLEKYRLP